MADFTLNSTATDIDAALTEMISGDVTHSKVTVTGANSELDQTTTMTVVNANRPVATDLTYKVQPASGGVQQSTDFHGVDILMYTSGNNVGSGGNLRLYPFESVAQNGAAADIQKLVPMYALWTNTNNGDVADVVGLRMWGKNQGVGTVSEATYIDIEKPENSGGGTINNLTGIKIPLMSDTFTGAKGVDIAETNNYIAGLEVGDLTTGNLTSLSAGVDRMIRGMRLEASAGFEITGGIALGFSDFTWTRIVALDDYTPASGSRLWSSHWQGNNRVELSVLADGKFRFKIVDNSGVVTNYDFNNPSLTNKQAYRITLVCNRTGNVSLYIGPTLKGTINIAASSGVNVGSGNTNNSAFYTQSTLSGADGGGAIFNFALTDIASRLRSFDFINAGERWSAVNAVITPPSGSAVSDFTAGNDGFTAGGNRGVLVHNQTVGGQTGALKMYKNGDSGGSYFNKTNAYTINTEFIISVDIYIPSSNTHTDGFAIKTNNNGDIHFQGTSANGCSNASNVSPTAGCITNFPTNTWRTIEANVTTSDNNDTNNIQISMLDGNNGSWQGLNDPNDDVMYIKNFKLLSRGAVLHHKMGEGTGTTVGDASTNNLDATTTGTVHWL